MSLEHNHQHIQELIIGHIYMDENLESSILDEIKSCEVCQVYFTQVKKMSQTTIDNLPDDHYWEHFYDRLEERYEKERSHHIIGFFSKYKPQILSVAAIMLLFLGFNLGKFLYKPVKSNDVISNIDAMEVQSLVTRTKVLFTQFNQLDEFNSRFFLEKQLEQSKELLSLASYLRRKHANDPLLESFIGELEKVFLSMKSIRNEDIYTIQSIQEKLNQGRMIAKLEYISTKEIE